MLSSLFNVAALALAADVASAAAVSSMSSATKASSSVVSDSKIAGSTTSDVFPPSGTKVNTSNFPNESEVGFPGPTPTGLEGDAIQTAPLYPYNSAAAAAFPLAVPQPHGSSAFGDKFDITKYWGNLSPWYSVSSA
ncbi:hypothetical protein KCU89_g13413, partial [Aureobasidium melanogenum]